MGSMKRLLVAMFAVVSAFALLAPAAPAKPKVKRAVVQNGTYGVLAKGGELIVFTVKDRRVRTLNFYTQITCQASDATVSEQRLFSAGPQFPKNRLVPRNGVLKLDWQEDGGGRFGNISVQLKFGVRDIANISVIVPEDRFAAGPDDALESCDGGTTLHFHRGFELSPGPMPVP